MQRKFDTETEEAVTWQDVVLFGMIFGVLIVLLGASVYWLPVQQ